MTLCDSSPQGLRHPNESLTNPRHAVFCQLYTVGVLTDQPTNQTPKIYKNKCEQRTLILGSRKVRYANSSDPSRKMASFTPSTACNQRFHSKCSLFA